jgi:ATP-binding cassette subfamily B protein/subfamily B ATP-binding cassette protein MsbA
MGGSNKSSRARYDEYRRQLRARRGHKPAGAPDPDEPSRDERADPRESGSSGRQSRPPSVPTAEIKSTHRGRSFVTLFRAFWGFLQGHRRTLVFALTTLTVSTILGLVPLYGTKLVVDNVLGGQPLPPGIAERIILPSDPGRLLTIIAITMVVLSVVSLGVGLWGRWQATRISKRVAVFARRKLFDHVVRLPLHRIYQIKSGGVASVLREDAGGIGDLVFSMIYNPSRAIIQLVGSLVVLVVVDWRMLIGSLVLLPTVWYTHRTWVARIRPFWRDIRMTRQSIDGQAAESFGGIRIIRGFARGKTETARFTTSNHFMARQELYAWWWMRGVDAAWGVLIPLATAVLLWYGGSRVLADAALVRQGVITASEALTIGDLVVFLAYLTALLGPIATLAQSATTLQNGLAGLDRTLDLLAEPVDMPSRQGAIRLDRRQVEGRITLTNVTFTYPSSETPVLREVSVDAAPGETIALVGPSGAGKTTLCNLIARFYDPQGGRIELDGVDLRDIDVESFRRLLGIVEQDTFLFDGTIAENIGYGKQDATREEIVDAARKANAHGFIVDLDHSYDTLIGERGVRLSGGQRQRLTIARAILADPKILILDEATSNLDTESERIIQASLRTLMAGRTSFVIAHRLSTVASAHRIVVIEAGRIIEEGTHEDLMARSGPYRRMVELQTHPVESDEAASMSDAMP